MTDWIEGTLDGIVALDAGARNAAGGARGSADGDPQRAPHS